MKRAIWLGLAVVALAGTSTAAAQEADTSTAEPPPAGMEPQPASPDTAAPDTAAPEYGAQGSAEPGSNATPEPTFEEDGHGKKDDSEKSLVPMVGFNIGGMVSMPLGNSADRFKTGGGFALGVMFRPRPFLGLQLEYSYSWYGVKDDLLPGGRLDASHTLQYWDLNVVVRPVHVKSFGMYVIAGPGVYHRNVEVTRFDGVAATTYCDPWLYLCYPAAVPVSSVLASRSTTDFGIDAGIGFYFVLHPPLRVYLEGRFHYIWGPDFTDVSGKTRSANGEYLPITLGLAF